MDKEQAIDLLDNLIGMIEDNQDNDYDTAFRMAIEALKAQLFLEGTTSDLISRTETVEHLRRVLEATVPNTDYDEGYIDGIEFGISTVSTMPTIQLQSTAGQLNDDAQSTNLIDRQAAIDALDKIIGRDTSGNNAVVNAMIAWSEYIRALPPAQPEPKEGRWIRTDCGLDVECKCSRCGYRDFVEPMDEYWFNRNYCPYCGAHMKGATP